MKKEIDEKRPTKKRKTKKKRKERTFSFFLFLLSLIYFIGLLPGETYSISVKVSLDGKISRAEPHELSVVVSENDIQNVNFIAFLR